MNLPPNPRAGTLQKLTPASVLQNLHLSTSSQEIITGLTFVLILPWLFKYFYYIYVYAYTICYLGKLCFEFYGNHLVLYFALCGLTCLTQYHFKIYPCC